MADKVKEFAKAGLEAHGIKILKQGSIKGETIDKKKLIDQHYFAESYTYIDESYMSESTAIVTISTDSRTSGHGRQLHHESYGMSGSTDLVPHRQGFLEASRRRGGHEGHLSCRPCSRWLPRASVRGSARAR